MSDDTRDTTPAPPPGVDPDILDAAADDIEDLVAVLQGSAHSLENLMSGLRARAAEARTTK